MVFHPRMILNKFSISSMLLCVSLLSDARLLSPLCGQTPRALPTPQTASEVPIFCSGTPQAAERGVWQIELKIEQSSAATEINVESIELAAPQIVFTRPDGRECRVDMFDRGDQTWVGRAYCQIQGPWKWRCLASGTARSLNDRSGEFTVVPANYPGKLRKAPRDPHQFAFDNGEWFLHIGDTGYRYLTDTEPLWEEYLDQASAAGFTKIRTWFCRSRHNVEALLSADRTAANYAYWNEMERRLLVALQRYPQLQFQLIPYGEDTQELHRYGAGDAASQWISRYAQARFSAFPNVQWCISNDQDLQHSGCGRCVPPAIIDQIGHDMQQREAWDTLLTNHQMRHSGYAFSNAPWSDIVTLEDLDQVAGAIISKYLRMADDPVVNDEDRYGVYRSPKHDRYFFRRLMWSSLLSGGHASYGGLDTFEPFEGADKTKGVQGYQTAVDTGLLDDGAQDFRWIVKFFREAEVELTGMQPAPELAGKQTARFNAMHDSTTLIVYAQQPSQDEPELADVSETAAHIELQLPVGMWQPSWFNPREGEWAEPTEKTNAMGGAQQTFTAPFDGDAILLLRVTQ